MTTITIDRELLEQALDALSGYRRELGDSQPCDAEQALSAALAAQPPAPAWECKAGGLKKLTQDQYERQTRAIQAHYTRIEPAPAWHDAPEREAFDALIKDAEHIHVPSAEKAWKAACAWQKRKDEAICAGFSQEAYNRYRASRREYDDGQCDAANALADKIRGVE
jgi:hypothetical protein